MFHRLMTGAKTPHTTAKEGHENLAICLAIDLAAKTGNVIDLPADLNDLESYFEKYFKIHIKRCFTELI